MDLFEAIDKRHSYRKGYTGAPVPRKDLLTIVLAGIRAPSAYNQQVASFVIIDDPGVLHEIITIVDRPLCETARAMIACVVDPRLTPGGVSFGTEDCAAAVENMLLAITAMGYASVWLDGVLRMGDKAARIADLLQVPEDMDIHVLLPVGVPAEACVQKEKHPIEQRAWFNRYKG